MTRVSVSPRTRRAAQHQLFTEEVGDSRLRFRFDATWSGVGSPPDAEIAFLAAAARNLRHLGRSRRRGRGECLVSLVAVDGVEPTEDLIEAFAGQWIEETWSAPEADVAMAVAVADQPIVSEVDGEPLDIDVLVRLIEPMLVSTSAEAGNTYTGITEIPGTTLLGSLVARSASRNGADAAAELARLLRRGGVTVPFLGLHHTSKSGDILYPSSPVPMDVHRCARHPWGDPSEPDAHPDVAFTGVPDTETFRCPICTDAYGADEAKMDPIGGRWYVPQTDPPKVIEPSMRSELHIRIDEQTGRAADGDLFGYVALDSGQYLYGVMRCPSREVWDRVRDLASIPEQDESLELYFGKATGRGYGHAAGVFRQHTSDEVTGAWLGRLSDRLPEPSEPFTLLLMTPAIIQDTWGRHPTSFDTTWLSEELGLQVRTTPDRGFAKTRLVDGFYAHIGLPRWRDLAFDAGSIVRLQVADETVEPARITAALANAERRGIGMRRHEGFGQIVINHPAHRSVLAPETRLPKEARTPFAVPQSLTKTGVFPAVAPGANQMLMDEADFESESVVRINSEIKKGRGVLDTSAAEAIARALISMAALPLDEIKVALEAIEGTSQDQLAGETEVWTPERGEPAPRSSKTSRMQADTEAAVSTVKAMIDDLEQRTSDTRLRRFVVRQLADAIIDACSIARTTRSAR